MHKSTYYFIGVGGIGMSSIARFLLKKGARVGGYDKTPSLLTKALEDDGLNMTYKDTVDSIPEGFETKNTRVIFTPAIPETHPQKKHFENQGNRVQKRAVFLGEITQNIPTIAVAGTHGKTTTTAILAHLFHVTNQSFTAFIGGVLNERKSNLISTGMDTVLVEADEFDRSFLQLHPALACITSIDADHLDIYGTEKEVKATYQQFHKQITTTSIVEKSIPFSGLTYSIYEEADYSVSKYKPEKFGYRFDLHTPQNKFTDVYFSQLGLHNLSNSLAAFALASQYGIEESALCSALGTFQGVERRLQLVYESVNHILIDDYAHHPTEIAAIFETLADAYPDEKKCVVFQPHLYSRTRDFMNAFAKALSHFDFIFVLPIYPARELPIKGINSAVLVEEIQSNKKAICIQKEDVFKVLSTCPARIKVMLGAGDIGLEVDHLKHKLMRNEKN